MKMISTPDAPAPAGHYSQAVVHGDLVFVSGQLAVDAATGRKIAGSVEEQTRIAFESGLTVLGYALGFALTGVGCWSALLTSVFPR